METKEILTTGKASADDDLAGDPFARFAAWFEEAKASEPNDPNGMALATSGADAMPDARMVLMKEWDANGFVFYTNAESQKGSQLAANRQAAGLFHWKSLRRQVRFRGPVSIVPEAQSDAYFESRPRDSRIGAWASQQSRPLESRFALEKAVAVYAAKYAIGAVPRPPHWQGYRIAPIYMEFWRDRPFRLHERVIFQRATPADAWSVTRFYP